MSVHQACAHEEGIGAHLGASGWLYEPGAAERYDRPRAPFPEDLSAWEALEASHGPAPPPSSSPITGAPPWTGRVRWCVAPGVRRDGTVPDREGLRVQAGLRGNAEWLARCRANRLRVVRLVRASLNGEQRPDLVLFLNGLPVATAGLKSEFTQRVGQPFLIEPRLGGSAVWRREEHGALRWP